MFEDKHKVIVTGLFCISLAANAFLGFNVLTRSDDTKLAESQKETEVSKEPEKTEKEPVSEKQTVCSNGKDYAKLALEYLDVVKNGDSTDIYVDRFSKMKGKMSESLYSKLSPAMSEENIEKERAKAKEVDPSLIVSNTLKDTSYYYQEVDENKYIVCVIYTIYTKQGDSTFDQRYLTRIEVSNENGKYMITNIYEDSLLSNGLYGSE